MNELKDIQQQKKLNILLLGDSCTDEYLYGYVEKISPEAPVPIFIPNNSISKPGMVNNVYKNLTNLNCNVHLLKGEDSLKTRLIDTKSNQQLVRIDRDEISFPCSLEKEVFLDKDAVVISDYNKGFVTESVIKNICNIFKGPIFIDTKKQYVHEFTNAFIKINQKEYNNLKTYTDNIIVTQGSKGASYKGKHYPTINLPLLDVCGAGDTFLASLSYFYLLSRDIDFAIKKANIASSITIQHLGVYAPTLEEIYEAERKS